LKLREKNRRASLNQSIDPKCGTQYRVAHNLLRYPSRKLA